MSEIVLVTGGTSGIGLAIAKAFIKNDSEVILFGTNPLKGESALKEITQEFPNARIHFFQVDVSKTEAVETTIKEILSRFGKIDVLVNNAGITRDGLLMKMSESEWDEVLDTNAKSCYNTMKAVVRSMLKARKGKIINIASVIGLIGNPGQVNYAASKGAMIAMTKATALELASRNIQVNCVAPGFIDTQMTGGLTEPSKASILAKIPIGRMGKPEEIAHAVLFLASDKADYITGQVLTVDGGMVM